jgi:hypothetical protein
MGGGVLALTAANAQNFLSWRTLETVEGMSLQCVPRQRLLDRHARYVCAGTWKL